MSVPSSGRGRGGRGTRRPSGAQDRTSSSSRGADRSSDTSQDTSRRQPNDGDTLGSPIAAQGVSQATLPPTSPDHHPPRPSRSQQQARDRRHWNQIDHWRQDQPALAGVRGPTTASQSGRRQAEVREGQGSPSPQTPLASRQQRKQRTGTLMVGSPQPTAVGPSSESTMVSSLEGGGGGVMAAQDPLSLRTANLQLQPAPPLSQGFYRPPVPGSIQAPPRGYGANQPYGNHPTTHPPPQAYPYYQQQQVMYPAPLPHHQGSILQVPPPPPQYYHPEQPLSYPQPMPAPAQQQDTRRYRQPHHGGQATSIRASPHSAGTTSAAPPPAHYGPQQGRPQQPPGPYRGRRGGGGGGQYTGAGRGIMNRSLVSSSTSGDNRHSSSGPDHSTSATTPSDPSKPKQEKTSTSTPAAETGLTELDRGEQSLPEASGPAAMRSEHVMWVGNIPSNATQEELLAFFSTLPPDPNAPLPEPAHGIVSIFFIPRSKCAFINLTSEQRLKTAVEIFNGRQLRPQEARSLRLVCRIRQKDEEAQAGVGHQRGRGMHVAWYKEQKQKQKQTADGDGAAAAESTAEGDKTVSASKTTDVDGQQSDGGQKQQPRRSRSADGVKGEDDESGDSSLPLPRSLSSTDSSNEGPQQRKHGLASHNKKEDGNQGGGSNDSPSDHSGGSTSFGSSNSELLSQPAFAIRYFILKSHDVKELDLAVQKGEWATQRHNIAVLTQAFRNSKTVYLIFSANQSGAFFGYAKMKAQTNSPPEEKPHKEPKEKTDVPPATPTADEHHLSDAENLPATGGNEPHEAAAMEHEEGRKQQEAVANRNGSSGTDDEMPEKEAVEASSAMMAKQSDSSPPSATLPIAAAAAAAASSSRPFSIEWIQTRPLPFYVVKGLRNPWNDGKSVRVARDGTEISPDVGAELLKSWERHVENQSQQQQQQQGKERDGQ